MSLIELYMTAWTIELSDASDRVMAWDANDDGGDLKSVADRKPGRDRQSILHFWILCPFKPKTDPWQEPAPKHGTCQGLDTIDTKAIPAAYAAYNGECLRTRLIKLQASMSSSRYLELLLWIKYP
jgi:hypothetical protein